MSDSEHSVNHVWGIGEVTSRHYCDYFESP